MSVIELEGAVEGADKYRKLIGRQRWYTLGDWEGPSVTAVKKAAGGDWSFVTVKRLGEALYADPHLLDGLDLDDTKRRLRALDRDGLSAAGDRGTAVHTYIERERSTRSTAADAGYYDAVDDLFDTYDITTLAAEFVAINQELNGVGYGGTCDALIEIGGTPYLVDWKTRSVDSKHGAYPEEAMQLGAYWGAERWIDPDADAGIDKPDGLDMGLIVSIKPDGARLYPIDLKAAYSRFCDLHAWWVSRRTEREPIGRVWPLKKLPVSPPTPDTDSPAVTVEAVGDVEPAPEPPAGAGSTTLDEQKARWRAMPKGLQAHIVWPDDRTDPEAIKAALDAVDRDKYRSLAAQPEPAPVPEWPVPDDGRMAKPEFVADLIRYGHGMTAADSSAMKRFAVEAQTAGYLWGRSADGTMSERRHDLVWTALYLLENGVRNHEQYRELAVAATGDDRCADARAPLGAVLGHLTAEDTARFMSGAMDLVKAAGGGAG